MRLTPCISPLRPRKEAAMRKSTAISLAIFATGVVVAGVYLAPSGKEIALMQMHDSDFSAALKHYTQLQEQGDNSINVLIPLLSLHEHYGDLDKAIALLKD